MYSVQGGFMTVRQAAAYLDLGLDTVRDLIHDGTLSALKEGEGKRARYYIHCSSAEAHKRRMRRRKEKPARLKAYLKDLRQKK